MTPRAASQWAGHPVEELRARWGRESVHVYGKVESTNAVARDLADEGAPQGTLVLAREQTAGRGREGRSWHSPPGGLYLSAVFRPARPALPPLASVLAGLGVTHRLDLGFPGLEPALKWPNDIVVDGGKLGGVLPEASSGPAGPRFLVVGVGLNVTPLGKDAPKEARRGATSLSEHLEEADPLAAADAVVAGLEMYLEEPPASADAATLELLDRYDWLRERRFRVRTGEDGEGIVGVGVGIAPDGALLFRPDRGALRRLASATILSIEDGALEDDG